MVYIYEYIWLDHKNGYRTKTKVAESHIFLQHNPGFWNFDGSSTEQADGHDSEVYIKPVRMCRDPFRKDMDNAFLVLAFGGDFTASNGTFTIQFPTAGGGSELLRLT